ncbi:ABC transporter substrate-binding protein [Kribbella sp. WER1]
MITNTVSVRASRARTGRALSRRTFIGGVAGVGGAVAAGPLLSACGSGTGSSPSGGTVDLNYLYPVGVSGPLAKTMQSLVDDFNKAHPKIRVKPSFTGDYTTNLTKIQTAVKGGNPPDVSILSLGDQQSLLDVKALQPIDELAHKNNVSIAFDDFYPAFLNETKSDGGTYGLPFQRSTPVLFYNADALHAAGATSAPATWDDVVSTSEKMMAAKKVQWGVHFPTVIWQFQGLAMEAGQDLNGSDLSHVAFNTSAAIKGLSWLVDLATKYKVSPQGVIDAVSAPAAFSGGKVGYLYNSSGGLTSILQQSKFKVGTAFMPKDQKYGAPTGGGNLYVFKNIPAARQAAALTFIEWMTQPAQAARWSVATGYVPSRKAVVDTAAWKQYSVKYPQANTAIQQLQYAAPSLNSHATSQVSNILLGALQAAVSGQSSASDALGDAQKKADSILAQYQ